MRNPLNFLLSGISSILIVACASAPTRDLAPAPIEVGLKRIETEICGQVRVGENGCVYPKTVKPKLRIRRIYQGLISLVGANCSLDRNFVYSEKDPIWLEVDLGPYLRHNPDCQIDIYQYVFHPNQELYAYEIRGFRGTVTVAECPSGANCEFTAAQLRERWKAPEITYPVPGDGEYKIHGCGELINEGRFHNFINLAPEIFEKRSKEDCLYTTAARTSESKVLFLHKVGRYSEKAVALAEPSFTRMGSEILVRADPAVALSEANGEFIPNSVFFYHPSGGVDELRFYTMHGRSLIVRIRNQQILSAE